MKIIDYTLPQEINKKEFSKLIGFISADIRKFEIEGFSLRLYIENEYDAEKIKEKTKKTIEKYFKNNNCVEDIILFESEKIERIFTSREKMEKSDLLECYGDGLISLKNDSIILYKYFDERFKKIAKELGSIEKKYPTLLPIKAFQKTGYLKTSPQYSMFCSCAMEDIDNLKELNTLVSNEKVKSGIEEPKYVLSTAACFHSYLEYQNETLQKNTSITFNQNVFRHEGRFNWNDFGRLRDYNVREIVFLGDKTYVENMRRTVVEKSKEVLIELGLTGKLCITSDPFVMPNMQLYKKIQINEETKYELQLEYDNEKYLAVASFNLHADAFTTPFNIKIDGMTEAVTGCVGFGIERCVLAFIAQYGVNRENWPEIIKKYIGAE